VRSNDGPARKNRVSMCVRDGDQITIIACTGPSLHGPKFASHKFVHAPSLRPGCELTSQFASGRRPGRSLRPGSCCGGSSTASRSQASQRTTHTIPLELNSELPRCCSHVDPALCSTENGEEPQFQSWGEEPSRSEPVVRLVRDSERYGHEHSVENARSLH